MEIFHKVYLVYNCIQLNAGLVQTGQFNSSLIPNNIWSRPIAITREVTDF